MITKEQWIELCKKYNKWCSFEEVENCTYDEAEEYIKTIPVWIPM